MSGDKLDPARIMERLRQLLADCEAEIQQPTGWRVHIHVGANCYPDDGGGGMVSFSVSSEREDDDEDNRPEPPHGFGA
jgi:hypothetical protein